MAHKIPSDKMIQIKFKQGADKFIGPGEVDEISLTANYFTYRKNGQIVGQIKRDNILEWEIMDDE